MRISAARRSESARLVRLAGRSHARASSGDRHRRERRCRSAPRRGCHPARPLRAGLRSARRSALRRRRYCTSARSESDLDHAALLADDDTAHAAASRRKRTRMIASRHRLALPRGSASGRAHSAMPRRRFPFAASRLYNANHSCLVRGRAPGDLPKGVVALVHDIGDNGPRDAIAQRLRDLGFAGPVRVVTHGPLGAAAGADRLHPLRLRRAEARARAGGSRHERPRPPACASHRPGGQSPAVARRPCSTCSRAVGEGGQLRRRDGGAQGGQFHRAPPVAITRSSICPAPTVSTPPARTRRSRATCAWGAIRPSRCRI